jgi:cytidylate kinase
VGVAIITISRGTFAGGERLSALLAKQLGYRTVTRERLYQKVQSDHGFDPDELATLMEGPCSQGGERKARVSIGERRRHLFIAVQASLTELVRQDNVVYTGLSGHLLLPDVSHVLRVRLIAPRGKRIDLCMEAEGLDRVAATRKIDQVDAERGRWTQSFFGVAWGDPLLFDLVINLECLAIEDAARIVVHGVSLERFRTTPASQQRMEDLALSSQVAACLNADPATASFALVVRADSGVIKLLGIVSEEDHARISKRIASIKEVRGLQVVERTPA